MIEVFCISVLMLLIFVHIKDAICNHYRKAAIKALTGLWADYDHVPYQLAEDKFEAMQEGLLVVYDANCTRQAVYQLDWQAAADWFDANKDGKVDWLERGHNHG